jgi:hypothetical protein
MMRGMTPVAEVTRRMDRRSIRCARKARLRGEWALRTLYLYTAAFQPSVDRR